MAGTVWRNVYSANVIHNNKNLQDKQFLVYNIVLFLKFLKMKFMVSVEHLFRPILYTNATEIIY